MSMSACSAIQRDVHVNVRLLGYTQGYTFQCPHAMLHARIIQRDVHVNAYILSYTGGCTCKCLCAKLHREVYI